MEFKNNLAIFHTKLKKKQYKSKSICRKVLKSKPNREQKPLARKRILVQTPFSYSALKLE